MRNIKYLLPLFYMALTSASFSAELPQYLYNFQNKALEINSDDYSDGKKTAIKDKEYLGDFTNHTEEHVLMVTDKTIEIMDAFEKAIKNGSFQKDNTFSKNSQDSERLNFGVGNINKATIVVASIYHDAGMKSGGYILDKEGKVVLDDKGKPKKATDGNDIRKNHALNSAIVLLVDRDFWKNSEADIDVACLLCFAHSKSTSGVRDLSRKSDWINGFDKLDRVIKAYNAEHEKKIYFNRERFENNEELLSALSTSALAIRLGDVSRDSGRHARAQNGGEIVVYKSTVNSFAGDAPGEAENARVYNYRTGFVKGLFSRQVHIGEQNNVLNHTMVDGSGKVYHEMTIDDGNYAPYCTFQNVIEHCGEIESAPDADMYINILLNNDVTPHFRKVYNQMRQAYYDQKGNKAIKIKFYWD
ncbi:MAG: hypothetical protein J6Z11_00010 [Candidatus Riflebacteria bacterium]|nr:hypothetical protein [Candidatus Riflebacteria bacterium]